MKAKTIKLSYHVLIGFILYKLFSLASNIVLSYKYGASQYSDAYIVSIAVPVFIASLAIALTAGLFYRQAKKEKKLNTFFISSVMMVIALILSAAVFLYPDIFTKIFAYGFNDKTLSSAGGILKMTVLASIPILVICSIKSYARGVNSTLSILIESMPVYLSIIIGIILSRADNLNIIGTSYLSGYAVSAVLIILLLLLNKNKSDNNDKQKEDIKYFILYLAPVCLNLFVYQIGYFFDRNIASTLNSGSISALFYSQSIIQVITGILFFIITVNLFSLKKSVAKNDIKSAQESIIKNTDNIMLVFVPVSLFVICFASPIVMGLFERGAFSGNNRLLTSQILIAYALGILPMGLKFILDNVYFAYNDRKTPIITSVIAVLLNIGLDFLLVVPLKLFGIALASSISYVVAAMLMTFKLKNRIDSEKIVSDVKNMLKVLLSGIPISIITLIVFSAIFYSMTSTLWHIILCMASAAIVFVIGYRFALKRLCDDVDLHVNIKGLRE
ncbi:MAG: hypothetical protein GYA50_10230, partial [Eubacteriaceae bacterium]|nr:hypothetical protein [Eubacteriaceae bacterium]